MFSKIESIEYFLPNKNKFYEKNFQRIYEKTGILNTRIKKKNEDVITLAQKACLKLKDKINNVDGIIFVAQTPRYLLPSCSCILQDSLKTIKAKNIYTLDINMGCSGFNYGLSVADSLIKNKIASKILLVCSDTYSDYISKNNTNRYLFSDAASATIIAKSKKDKMNNFYFYTDGSKHQSIIIKKNEKNLLEFSMNGKEVFGFTLDEIPKHINKYLKKINRLKNYYRKFFLHQASGIILDNLGRKLDKKLIYKNIKNIGNTTSSSIPISLKIAYQKNEIKKGDDLLLCGFGVGMSLSIASINF